MILLRNLLLMRTQTKPKQPDTLIKVSCLVTPHVHGEASVKAAKNRMSLRDWLTHIVSRESLR